MHRFLLTGPSNNVEACFHLIQVNTPRLRPHAGGLKDTDKGEGIPISSVGLQPSPISCVQFTNRNCYWSLVLNSRVTILLIGLLSSCFLRLDTGARSFPLILRLVMNRIALQSSWGIAQPAKLGMLLVTSTTATLKGRILAVWRCGREW
jgi:hypothetical protein